ncbi:MAG: response regulator, partial [Frankiaceae bacterium]|nr:response regulator [Frankiaceae bacterium]
MVNDPFDVDSEVALDLRSVDWARTPLGDPTDWPQSLTTVVRTVLASRFSMWMAWGPELTFFCNDAYRADTLGKKYPWALGRPAREVWAEIWDDIGPRIDSVLDTGQATWDEALLLFLERSGYVEETYHTFSYSPLADDGGDIVGMLCVVTEDTERVIAQRRMELLRNVGAETAMIRDETDFLTAICQQLESDKQTLPFTFIYLYDADETYAELRCATGVPDGSDLAPDLIDLNAPSAWPAADLLEGEALVIGELSARFADVPRGDWPDPPIDALLVPLRVSGQDRPIGFVVTAVNRYRPLDASYRAFIDLLVGQIGTGLSSARAYEAERARADALAALDHAKTTFFTNISHEFRTPLTLLLGPAEDALADADNALNVQQRERIEIINRNGQRLLKLVNTLLDFSRLESDRMTAHFEPVDISAVTTELAGAFRSAVERAGLTLNIDCQPVEAPVFIDREMWAKVVLNLLSNALKFTFEGSITVTVRQIANQVELAVTDTGTGIAPEAIGSLFERFQRVAGARSRSHEGSGIGLALVAELVELHGGIVAATSQVDVGSTFRVVLPTGSEHLPAEQVSMDAVNDIDAARVASGYLAEASRWGEPAGPVTPSEDPNRPSVLVVDDNADMREYVVRLLSTEYAVTWATDGMDALDRIRAAAPDLILTDVMMPRMDGFELLDTLRADPATSDIPVVMLSARAGDDAMVEGLEAGADDYLVKPFTTRELRARVRANLELERVRRARNLAERNRRMLAQAQRLARLGSWEIDVESGVITASEDFYEQLQLTSGIDAGMAMEEVFNRQVHPADREVVIAALAACTTHGTPFDSEFRVQLNDGEWRVLHAIAELERDPEGTPVRVRGSIQDVTERREAEAAIAEAAAAREASEREHRIADQLQRSLLPPSAFRPDHLEIATYYRAGVEGTQVGGDWYDVIE